MGHGVQPPSPLQFTLVSRYCRVSGIISDPILTPRSKRSPLFCCDCISSLVGHILIWREQFREVRSEVYNNEVNSSGKILAGTNIIFPGAILPVLQPGLCCQGDTALLALAHSKQLWITTQQSLRWRPSHKNEIQQCLHYRGLNNLSKRTIALVSLALSDTFVQKFSSTPCLLFAYIVQTLLSFCTCFMPQSDGAQTFSPQMKRDLRLIWSLDTLRNTGHPYYVYQHSVLQEKYRGNRFSQIFEATTVFWTPGLQMAAADAQINLRGPTSPALLHHTAELHTHNTASPHSQWVWLGC